MSKLKTSNVAAILFAVFFLTSPLFQTQQSVFAGDSGCQSGRAIHKYDVYSEGRPEAIAKQQEQFQAAQIRNGQDHPPTAGSFGSGDDGDSGTRTQFSYFASIFFLFGGIWLLAALLRERWAKRYAPKSAGMGKVWNFALKPSFALSAFAFLFAAIIIGSTLTSPTVTSAQKREQNNQLSDQPDSTNAAVAVINQPVFKSAQQFGGNEGITQIGAPVYEKLSSTYTGNYYVRGTFSGTLTLGNTTLTATQGLDLFFAKFDANENLLWVRHGSGITNAPSDDLSVEGVTALELSDTNGVPAVYVAGSFVKTLTLPGGANPGVTLNDDGVLGYNYETFLAKYDTDGNLLWAKGGNSASPKNSDNLEKGQNTINKIVFDGNSRPYLAGIISGGNFLDRPISDFYCSDSNPCAIRGKSDVLLARIDQETGVPDAIRTIGGSGDDNGLDLAIDNITNPNNPQFYLVGNFDSPTIDIRATGGGPFNNPNNAINSFVLKFNANTLVNAADGIWVNILHNNAVVGVNQVVTDPINGTPYVTGYYKGSLSSPSPFGTFILTNNRTGADDAALAGFVTSLDAGNGSFINLAGLGGVGNALTIAPGGNIYVVGSLWDTGTFTSPNGVTRTLDSFGGNDLFVAEINKGNFDINSLKAVAGTGYQGLVAVGDPSTADGATKNSYSPLGIALSPSGLVISGDFSGTLSLDCLTLTTPGTSRHAYIAKFLGLNETTSCRIWTKNITSQGGQWNKTDNWNGGIIPASGDSVYVPYDKEAAFDPVYDTTTPVPLSGLSIADNQTLTLQQNLIVNNRLDLLGGFVDAGSNKLTLGVSGQVYNIHGGRVIGKMEKQFAAGSSFTFPVGTANGYSPVTLSNISGTGNFTAAANQNAYPNTPNLPDYRLNRWWQLTNGGLTKADVTFQYLEGDLPVGAAENNFRTYRIDGGTATLVNSTIDAANNQVTAANVTQFSPWTLAQAFTYEADVQSRPNGDGFIDASDVQQIRRFAVGLDTPLRLNEFQRADASPRSTGGDGAIDDGDVQQARRYSVGTDAPQQAGGPSSIAPPLDLEFPAAESGDKLTIGKTLLKPALKIGSQTSSEGQTINVPILVDTKGIEAGYTFGINYDAAILTNPLVTIGSAGGDVIFNANTPGAIGFSVTTFSGRTIAAGTNLTLVIVSFTVAANAPVRRTIIAFSDTPAHRKVSGVDPNTPIAQPSYTTGTVTIDSVSTSVKRISGRVMAKSGRGIAGVLVMVTNAAGVVVGSARTNGFGYYTLTNMLTGENYAVSVESKTGEFASQMVAPNGNPDGINFTSLNR